MLGKYKDSKAAQALLKLPRLFGGAEVFEKAYELFDENGAKESLDYLKGIYEYLQALGLGDRVIIDLGLVNLAEYYTGIIFYGYTFGTGEPVVKGGRYDSLLASFGKDAPSIGFAIVVDQLLAAIQRQKITLASPDYNVLLVFAENKISEAVKKAGELRGQGLNVAMIPMNPAHDKAYYTNYAEQNRFAKVEWMDGE